METLANLAVGTPIRVQEGTSDVIYQIAGFNVHGTGTVTLSRKLVRDTTTAFGSTTFYNGSTLDVLCNTTIYNSFPEKLRRFIQTASIVCATAASASVTLERKCFALSITEVMGSNNNNIAENSKLPLFGTTATERIRYTSEGTAATWWLRSWSSSTNVYIIAGSGSQMGNAPTSSTRYLPAFVLPSDRPVDSILNADGSYNLSYAEKIDIDVPLGTMTERPNAIRTTLQYSGVLTELYACNNYDDSEPVWEPIQDNTEHVFANTVKTAANWSVAVRVLIERSDSGELIWLTEFPAIVR